MEKCTITMVDQKQNYDHAIRKLEADGIQTVWEKRICNSQDPKTVIQYCKDSTYIINGVEIWNNEVIDACPDLKLIVRYGVGYNNIDVETATKRGIAVAYLPGMNAMAVAEHAVLLMMASLRKVGFMNCILHNGGYKEGNELTPQFNGKTIGVYGCGRIGKYVCQMLRGFDCRVLAYDVFPDEKFAREHNVTYVSADELMRQSDIITVHVPVLPETVHSINKDTIAKMKDGVVIVNTSRGATVCSEDLREAILSGKVYAAGLDVYEDEGSSKPHALFEDLPQALLTPHVSASTFETYEKMIDKSVELIEQFRNGADISKWLLNPNYNK